MPEADRPPRAHIGFDAVLGFQLGHELLGGQLLAEDVDLLAHGRKVTGSQHIKRGEPVSLLGVQQR